MSTNVQCSFVLKVESIIWVKKNFDDYKQGKKNRGCMHPIEMTSTTFHFGLFDGGHEPSTRLSSIFSSILLFPFYIHLYRYDNLGIAKHIAKVSCKDYQLRWRDGVFQVWFGFGWYTNTFFRFLLPINLLAKGF